MAQPQREIILPESKPALEWILGRAVQKVSPKRRHSLVQLDFAHRLRAWARSRGEVGTEWRFRLAPPNEEIRPFVPDIAYLSYERMGNSNDDELEAPLMAPNVAVEIRSPDDRQLYLDHKIGVYLACGCEAVIVVDLQERTLTVHDAQGALAYGAGKSFTHPALPGFTLAIDDLFDVLRRPASG